MGERILFVVPDDVSIMMKLVDAVPREWGWVSGRLLGPHYRSPLSRTTGYLLSRVDGLRIVADGEADADRLESIPDLLEILSGDKEAKFFEFSLAGMGPYGPSLTFVKRMVTYLLGKVYRGSLVWSSGDHEGDVNDNPASVRMRFLPWQGYNPTQHSTIELQWDERYGGRPDTVASVFHGCRELGLTQLPATEQADESVVTINSR